MDPQLIRSFAISWVAAFVVASLFALRENPEKPWHRAIAVQLPKHVLLATVIGFGTVVGMSWR